MSKLHNLDEGYLNWLCSLVGPVRNPNPKRTYFLLEEQLFLKDFTWSIPNDDNRSEDGKALRQEFLEDYTVDASWMATPCNVLEMLVSLARRVSFESFGTPDQWFWKLIENLGFGDLTDEAYTYTTGEYVDVVLDNLLRRTYEPDGSGGLFPLTDPNQDQRQVEIWYQMAAYLLEEGI